MWIGGIVNCPYRKDSFYYWNLYKNCSCFIVQRNSTLWIAIGGEVHKNDEEMNKTGNIFVIEKEFSKNLKKI